MTGYGRLAAVLGLAVALGAGPALAEKGGQGKGHGNPHEAGQGGAPWVDGQDQGGPPGKADKPCKNKGKGKDGTGGVVITTNDRTVIQNYFIANPVGVTSLPPGIAKNVARGKPLPPGIAKKQAPAALIQQIPACRSGLECIVLGADLLILDAVHGVVSDIVRNVVR